MAEMIKEKVRFFVRRPDLMLALLGVVTGAAEILVSNHFRLNRAYFGYSIVIACLFYLVFHGVFAVVNKETLQDHSRHSALVFAGFSLLTLVFLLSSVWYLRSTTGYSRGWPYVILFLMAVVFTTAQIVFFETSTQWQQRVILIQILLLGIGFKASGFFLYPTMTGNDPFYHLNFIERLVSLQQVPLNEPYTSFPLFHMLISIFGLMSSIDGKSGFFFISVLQSLSFVSVYVMGRVLFDQKTGLLAFLFLSLSDYQIQWGVQIIPMTVGVMVFALVLMGVVLRNRYRKNYRVKWTVLLILWIVVMIFIHTLSSLIMMFSVSFLFLSFVLFSQKQTQGNRLQFISISFVLIAIILPVVYWSYNAATPAETFLARVALTIRMSLREAFLGDVQMISGAGLLSEWRVFLGDLGWVLLLVLTVVGILSCLHVFRRQATILSLAVLTGVLVFTTYGGALFGLRYILPARWISFLYVPASLFSAFGVKQVLNFHRDSEGFWAPWIRKCLLALAVFSTVATMVTSPLRSMPDSPLYLPELSIRPGFYNAEVKGMDHALAQQAVQIAASSKTGRYIKQISEIDPRKPSTYDGSALILVRQFDLRNGFFIPYPDYQVSDYVLPTAGFNQFLQDFCLRHYDNGEVFLYTVAN